MSEDVRHFTVGADGVRQFVVSEDDEGIRLDRWFKRHLPQIGFATVSRWARTGQIRVDGKRARPEDRLAAGQALRVPPGGEIAAVWVRALHEKMGKLANTGFEGEITAVADSVRLPREVILEMSESDYERIGHALDEALAREVRAGARTPAPRLVEGDTE